MKVKSESEVAQSCRTLSDPMDCSLPGSSVHGIFQANILEWGAIAYLYLKGEKHFCIGIQRRNPKPFKSAFENTPNGVNDIEITSILQFSSVQSLSCVRLFATPWTAAYQAPPSMGFARQEYGSGVPLPTSTNSKVPLHPSPILQPQVYSLCL